MLQFASQWLKKSVAVMTLSLMVVSASAQSVSAFTLTSGTSGSGTGVISATTVSPSLLSAVYSPSSSVLSNAKATPSSFKPSIGEQTTIHFDLAAPSTVWLDIMQNGSVVNRLYHVSGFHLSSGSYDTFWNGLNDTSLVADGTYQFLITAKLDADGSMYTAQDNIIVTSNPPVQPVVITTGSASPNPFNPSLGQQTFVSYTLNAQANLNIEVVDNSSVLTQLGSSPFTQNAGTYSISWNGKVGGVNAAAKTYYIRFTGKNDATPTPYVTTVPVTVDYGSSTPPTTNPKVLYVYAENGSFDPTVSSNRIHYAVDKTANAVVKILDSGNNVVRTFGTSSVTNGFDYFTNWDGRNDSNVLVPAGNYTAKVELALTPGGTVVDSKQSSPFAVTFGGTNNNAPVVTSVTANPSSFNPTNSETTSINYAYTSSSAITNSKVEILDGSVVKKTFNNMGVPFSWNGRDESSNILPNGTYTVKVSLTNANGTGTGTTTVTITSGGSNNSAPVVTSLYVNPSSFNPYNNESTTISYTLDKVATSARVEIWDGSNLRRTISNTGTATTTNTVPFNGRDDSNNILPVGTYTVKVLATNSYGTGSNTASVTITNSGNNGNCNSTNGTPNLTNVYASPSTFDPDYQTSTVYYTLDRSANVTVQILNSNSSLMRTLSDNVCRNNGSGTYSWDGRDMNGNFVNDGSYTVRVVANNGSGSDTEYTYITVNRNGNNNNCTTYNCTNGNLVLNMYVSPEIFNPRNGQTSTAYYNLSQTATVTTQILDRNGIVLRTLVDNISRNSNNYGYNTSYGSYNYADQWNGRDVYGNIVPDNIYQFRVTANANGQTDTKTAWVEVDTDGIIIGFPNGSTCGGYIDVSSNSHYCKAIMYLKELGVFTGYSDGTFRPYTPINRAETVKVILLALGIPVSNDMTTLFRDTDGNAWYAPFLRTAKRLGIIRGYPDGTFRPNQTINRVELLKVFLESSGVNIPYCNYAPYNDTPVNADTRWYIDYVCYAKSNGLMHDDGAGRFSPAAAMTRGDVADLFYQFDNQNLYNQYNNPYVTGNYTYTYTNTTNCGVNCYNCGTNYYNCNTSNSSTSYPVVSSLSASPSNFNPYNSESTTIYYTLSQASTVQVQIMDSNNSIRRTINGGSISNGYNNSTSWNGRDDNGSIVPTGTYTVRVTANNSYGTGSATTSVYVNNSGTNNTSGAPVVSGVSVSPMSFSPNSSQTTTVTYYLNRTGTIQVQVLDGFNNVRRTISSNLSAFTNTANTVVWNGRDDSNNILPNGTYTIKVLASNSSGTGSNSVGVTLY